MPKYVWSDFPFCTLIQSQQLPIHSLVVQTRNFQYTRIIHKARHPHKHISKPLPMVNHDLQLHVECFKFGVIISYKWTNGLLNVYMNDINSTINRWQTTKVLATNHNFYQIFLFKPLYLFLHTTLIVNTNSHNATWIVDLPIANNSLQRRYSAP